MQVRQIAKVLACFDPQDEVLVFAGAGVVHVEVVKLDAPDGEAGCVRCIRWDDDVFRMTEGDSLTVRLTPEYDLRSWEREHISGLERVRVDHADRRQELVVNRSGKG